MGFFWIFSIILFSSRLFVLSQLIVCAGLNKQWACFWEKFGVLWGFFWVFFGCVWIAGLFVWIVSGLLGLVGVEHDVLWELIGFKCGLLCDWKGLGL